jgi:ionotropic glutamate receptor
LDLLQTGMIDHWDSWFRPMPRQCKANVKKGDKKRETKHMPISLKNLTGAFLVLSVGLSISFLAFLVEQIISMIVKRNVGNVAEIPLDNNSNSQDLNIIDLATEICLSSNPINPE